MARITKVEIAAMIITAILMAVALGFFLGQNSGDSTVNVDGAESVDVVTLPPEAPADPELPQEPEIPESLTEISVVSAAEETPVESSGLLDLNVATVYDLEQLPDIGPVLAQRILDYREANGGFVSVDELKNIDGIGDKIFDSIVNLVEVGN